MRKSTQKKLMSIFILLMFGGSSLAYAVISAIPKDSTSTWAAHLSIVILDQEYTVPMVGFSNNQPTARVFTADESGILYKSVNAPVTLGDFFGEWNETFDSTCIFDHCNTNSSTVTMFVNGKVNDQFQNYIVQSGDYISIVYG
jgi:hypothetical protein